MAAKEIAVKLGVKFMLEASGKATLRKRISDEKVVGHGDSFTNETQTDNVKNPSSPVCFPWDPILNQKFEVIVSQHWQDQNEATEDKANIDREWIQKEPPSEIMIEDGRNQGHPNQCREHDQGNDT